MCDKCDEKRPPTSKITRNLSVGQKDKLRAELTSIQQTKFSLRKTVPRKLNTLWSDIMTDISLGMAGATNETEAWHALKRYTMLKAVLIRPIRGGGKR